ncbi:ribonuclease H-like domain-containing protein [Tanacetum coccineum]
MRTKPGVDSLSFDDLYNNLSVFESDVKGSTASPSSTQNVAFVSENTSSTNDVSTAYGVSNSSGHNSQYEHTSSYSLLANQSSCPQLDHEDLEQLDEFDLEEMDLKWQVTMISMRMKKFYKKTGRKLQFDAKEPVGFDKTKNTGNKDKDNGRRSSKQEDSKSLVTLDGEGVDWTSHSEDEQENYAFMACNSSGSDTEVTSCSKECKESYVKLKKLYDEQREQLGDASIEIQAYTQALKKVEAQLVAHQQSQLWYEEKIRFMKIDLDDKTDVLTYHKKLLAEAEKEKEDLKAKVEKWHNSSKNLNILLNSQMSARDKAGLGYGDQLNKGVLSYENEVFQSVFVSRTSDIEDSPVNDRYAEGMHAVPPPMTGIYIPSGPDKEIDDSQFTYGPKQSKPSESDARSSDFNKQIIHNVNSTEQRIDDSGFMFQAHEWNRPILPFAEYLRLSWLALFLLGGSKVADFTNLETIVNVSPIPTSRINLVITSDSNSWNKYLAEEQLQFKIQKVWILIDLPYGKKVIGTKWVYKNKKDEKGVVVRNKARLVAYGHRQEEGIDYDEMDVKSAFLVCKWIEEGLCVSTSSFKDPTLSLEEIQKKFDFASRKNASIPSETRAFSSKDEDKLVSLVLVLGGNWNNEYDLLAIPNEIFYYGGPKKLVKFLIDLFGLVAHTGSSSSNTSFSLLLCGTSFICSLIYDVTGGVPYEAEDPLGRDRMRHDRSKTVFDEYSKHDKRNSGGCGGSWHWYNLHPMTWEMKKAVLRIRIFYHTISELKDENEKMGLKMDTKISSETTYVAPKTRFSEKATQSKTLDTTSVASKSKIDEASASKARDKVVQIVLWVVDSGCSKHMTGDRSLLRNFVEKFMGTVRFGNDNFAAITGYDLEMTFHSKTCYVRNLEGDDLPTGRRDSNLYTISISDMAASSPICLMSKATSTKLWLWHRRLSHLNFGIINDLTKLDLVDGLPKFKYGKDHLCSACERGKRKKASHPPKLIPSDYSKLELLHMDLCGPYE